jgi:limonene-1,2-epoxide hydrolase
VVSAHRRDQICLMDAVLAEGMPSGHHVCSSELLGGAMGVGEEKLVMEFLGHGHGREVDVDAIVALMTDDVVFQVNVPTRKPRVGREAAREEIARGAAMATGDLDGEVLSMVSDDRLVFQERNTVFEMGEKRIALRLAAVFEVVDGKIAVWREYYDTVDLARQLGVDPALLVEE